MGNDIHLNRHQRRKLMATGNPEDACTVAMAGIARHVQQPYRKNKKSISQFFDAETTLATISNDSPDEDAASANSDAIRKSEETKEMTEIKSEETSSTSQNLTEEIQQEDAQKDKNEELIRLLAPFIGIDCQNPIWDDEQLTKIICERLENIRQRKLTERDWIIRNSESFKKIVDEYQSALAWLEIDMPQVSDLDGQKINEADIQKLKNLLDNITEMRGTLKKSLGELTEAVKLLPRKKAASEETKPGDSSSSIELEKITQENIKLKGEIEQLYSALETAENERNDYRQKLSGLQGHLEHKSSKPVPAGEMSNEVRNSVARLLLNNRDKYKDFQIDNLEQCLIILKEFLSDRVEILESAFISAREACNFEQPEKAFELMLRLVIDYRDALPGKGTSEAKKVFNDSEWAADETDSVDDKKRTFGGNVMREHLKIGNNEGAEKGWRCHFCYDSTSRKIIIGHCGKHLDFK